MSLEKLVREYAADLRRKSHKSRTDYNEAIREGWGHKAVSEAARRACLARIAEDLTIMLAVARSETQRPPVAKTEPSICLEPHS